MKPSQPIRVFPVFWEHPAVRGITLWGFRPGMWRSKQGANLVHKDGSARAAPLWLRGLYDASTGRRGDRAPLRRCHLVLLAAMRRRPGQGMTVNRARRRMSALDAPTCASYSPGSTA